MKITKIHGTEWLAVFGSIPNALLLCSITSSCASAALHPATVANDWNVWFAEYNVDSNSGDRDAREALTIFKNRFVPSTKGSPVSNRLSSDVGGSFNIQRKSDAYAATTLPVFAPSETTRSFEGEVFTCSANKDGPGYSITCKQNRIGNLFRSYYDPGQGVRWFDFYCGNLTRVCRYELYKGRPLLNPDQLKSAETASGG